MNAKVIQGPAKTIEHLLNDFLYNSPQEIAFIRVNQSITIDLTIHYG